MMLSKAIIASSLALLAAASPMPQGTNQCNTGSAQCCQNVKDSKDAPTSALLGLLGTVLQGVNVPIGLVCNPISVIGLGNGSSCNQNPVCCQNMSNSKR